MALVKQPRWAPSQRPYAILRGSAWPTGGSWIVRALWAGRKRGVTTVTVGTLNLWNHQTRDTPDTLDAALAAADMRYGGEWHHQWDGETLLVEPG
ncbi:MAG: hypothetical protein ACRCYR_03575, partial [Phycicoccus sp.]